MSIEENKKLARQFFEDLSRGDGAAVLDAYADDATLWTAGSLPFSGRHTLEEVGPLMAEILGAFPSGLRFTIQGITAEGDRVAVEAESHGQHASGRLYHNQYHFLMRFRDGKIREFKEYLDTMHADEVLVRGASADGG